MESKNQPTIGTADYPLYLLTREDLEMVAKKLDQSRESVAQLRYIRRQYCNVTISKCGKKSKYGRHQDFSYILASCLNLVFAKLIEVCVFLKHFILQAMPLRGTMMVVTFVTGRGKCETEVSWHRDDVCLGKITTGPNDLHLQGPGCQDKGIKHESKSISKRGERNGAIRKIDTYRQSYCPCCDHVAYEKGIKMDGLDFSSKGRNSAYTEYKWLNAMEDKRIFQEDAAAVAILDGDGPRAENPKKVRVVDKIQPAPDFKPIRSAHYQKLIEQTLSRDGFQVRPVRRLQPGIGMKHGKKWESIQHHEIISTLLSHGLLPRLVDENGNATERQILFTNNSNRLIPIGTRQIFQVIETSAARRL